MSSCMINCVYDLVRNFWSFVFAVYPQVKDQFLIVCFRLESLALQLKDQCGERKRRIGGMPRSIFWESSHKEDQICIPQSLSLHAPRRSRCGLHLLEKDYGEQGVLKFLPLLGFGSDVVSERTNDSQKSSPLLYIVAWTRITGCQRRSTGQKSVLGFWIDRKLKKERQGVEPGRQLLPALGCRRRKSGCRLEV